MNEQTREPVIEMRGIVKRFPGVLANDQIDLTLYKGEILGLLGENGAGKTTLMNVLYGLYQRDEGEITLRGQPVQIRAAHDAIAFGLGMVHIVHCRREYRAGPAILTSAFPRQPAGSEPPDT